MVFQSPPSTPAEVERSRPLDLPPEQVLEMTEEEWYDRVYRGDDVPQLTLRAVLVGSVLGFFLAFTNLYVGLMTGWLVGVAITACILSWAVWNGLLAVGIAKTPMTILETNCMQSTASSAGYSTGSTIISAVAAMLMVSATEANPAGEHIPLVALLLWTFFLGVLGIALAVPMKRNMINRERLRFPSGTAAAVTLQSLYSQGQEATRKARSLLIALLVGLPFPFLLELGLRKTEDGRVPLLPGAVALFDWLPGRTLHRGTEVTATRPSDWTVVLDLSPLMIGAGAIVGLRIAASMVLSGLLLAYLVGPFGSEAAWTNPAGEVVYATTAPGRAWREIGIWLGVPILVSSSLLQFGLQWRTFLRALGSLSSGGTGDLDPRIAKTEVPMSWFAAGVSVGGAGVVALGAVLFHIPVHYGILAVLLTFVLALVACRATGESDVTPIGGMGKLMQLTYGVLIPQSVHANLMTAAITSSAAASSADLLNDLKSGYLLGADPRRQYLAQLAGVVSGTLATVIGFRILVPDATTLNGVDGQPPQFPAPSAQAWKAVAEVFQHGIGNMHPVYQQAIAVGLGIGAVLVLLEVALPKVRAYLPSATGIGLGMILPFQYPLSMLIGAVAGWVWTRRDPRTASDYLIPIASGIVAGVSIAGVIVAFLNNVVIGGG